MAENTAIEWTDHTFNPWIGCTRISPACDHCYAADLAGRFGLAQWGAGEARVRTSKANWRKPLSWARRAAAFLAKHGRRQRVFCASMADIFDNEVPAEWRRDLFDLIDQTPELDWLLLTKRIGNVDKMLKAIGRDRLPDNVWLGATIATQDEAMRDIPKLVSIPATVRFLSMEPLLEMVTIMKWLGQIQWVIAGGESGRSARLGARAPAFRYLRDQCSTEGVPFLFKQWGEFGADGKRVGKKLAGRLLDGREHNAFPA